MKRALLILSIAGALVCSTAAPLAAAAKDKEGPQQSGLQKVTGTPVATMLNINRVASWYNANGEQERIPFGAAAGNSGLYYPRGTATAVYSSGLIWGGQFRDGVTPIIRVNGQSYNNGTKPGAILGLRTGLVEDPNAPDVRIWRIRRDYATANLNQDAAEINQVALTAVTSQQVADCRAQYKKDWAEWPAAKGAPFYDADEDGKYTPKFSGTANGVDVPVTFPDADEPGVADADQVIWYVANDIGVAQPWTCPASGMEMQTTIWGYARTDPIGNVIFKRFKLIYKGISTTPPDARVDSMYLCQWSDIDLGDAGDDFAGCDTLLSMGYCYNGKPSDASYAQFGLPPPGSGFDFLQGPLVYGQAGQDLNKNGVDDAADYGIFDLKQRGPGQLNLPMTSFVYFAAGGRYQDPPFNYNGAIQWYQMLRGMPPTPQGPPDPGYYINPVTQQPTTYWLSGDPVAGTGWLDGTLDNPGDRRILLTSGPFTMALGDTQELVSAWVGGLGTSAVNGVQVMKFNDRFVQTAYDSLFKLPKPPVNPEVVSYGINTEILLDWGENPQAIAKTESVIVIGNYQFEGYKLYQFPSAGADLSEAILLGQWDIVNGVTTISQPTLDPVSGDLVTLPVQYGSDNGVSRSRLVTTDAVRGGPFVPGQRYYFAVTAYNNTPDVENPFKTYESVPAIFTVIPETPPPGTRYPYSFGDTVYATSKVGSNDGRVFFLVDNSTKQKGTAFQVAFDSLPGGTLWWKLKNTTTNTVLYDSVTDLSGSVPYPVTSDAITFYVGRAPDSLLSVRDAAGRNVFGTSSLDPTYGILAQPASGASRGILDSLTGKGKDVAKDYELRFDGVGGWAMIQSSPINRRVIRVPFSAWDVGRGEGETPRRVAVGIRDSANTLDRWNVTPNGIVEGALRRVFEPLFITNITDPGDSAGLAAIRAQIGGAIGSRTDPNSAIFGAFVWDRDRDTLPPPVGTVVRFRKAHAIYAGDVFTFQTGTVVTGDAGLAKQDVQQIKVFPNPYYGAQRAETDRNFKYVTFSHLPPRATLRIFNLGGILVRTIEKTEQSQFLQWDLTNHNGLPVASGMYIVYIDMPDLGVTKIVKVAIIQEQQILRAY